MAKGYEHRARRPRVRAGVCDFCHERADVAVAEEPMGPKRPEICAACARWALTELEAAAAAAGPPVAEGGATAG